MARDLAMHDNAVHSPKGEHTDLSATSKAVRTAVIDADVAVEAHALMNP